MMALVIVVLLVALAAASLFGKTADTGRYLQPFAKILLALSARREKQNAKNIQFTQGFMQGTIAINLF